MVPTTVKVGQTLYSFFNGKMETATFIGYSGDVDVQTLRPCLHVKKLDGSTARCPPSMYHVSERDAKMEYFNSIKIAIADLQIQMRKDFCTKKNCWQFIHLLKKSWYKGLQNGKMQILQPRNDYRQGLRRDSLRRFW